MSNDINLATYLAEKYHAGQKYGDEDYLYHLFQVTASVRDGTTDERHQQVSMLHDILEDTACTESLLRTLFEDNVVDAVVAITKRKGEANSDYLARVKANPMARVVKIHDSFCNLKESLMRFDAKRVKKYATNIAFLVEA